MWRRFVVVEIRSSKIREMRFYLTFGFVGFKIVNKGTIDLFKGSEDFGFSNFMGWIEKYKVSQILPVIIHIA